MAVKYAVDEWLIEPNFRVFELPFEAKGFDEFKWRKSPGIIFFVLPKTAGLPFTYRPQRISPEKDGFNPITILDKPNYSWVKFHPSGFHKSEQWGDGMLQGWLSTNSGHPDSLAIFNAFKKSIKKRFEYLKSCSVYVGKEAAEYMDKGGRLTQDLRAPKTGDCKRVADA